MPCMHGFLTTGRDSWQVPVRALQAGGGLATWAALCPMHPQSGFGVCRG